MYKHQDNNDSPITLHDCRANRMKFKDGMVSFYFPEGIWISERHEANDTGNAVRTDAAKVRYQLLYPDDDVTVYVYKTKSADKAIRKEWKMKKLMQKVNDCECEIEFVWQYSSGLGRIIECVLHSKEKPYLRECELRMLVSEVTYLWNDLRPDATW